MCRRAHRPLLNSLGGCAGTCYLTYSVKNRPPFLFCIYSMKKTSGGGITMNTEYDSELICDPSSGWVSLRGTKPLRKYPQDPKRALWFFPSPITQDKHLPTTGPLWDLQKRGGPGGTRAPNTSSPLPPLLHMSLLASEMATSITQRTITAHGIYERLMNILKVNTRTPHDLQAAQSTN